ncbi:ribosomal-protein-alanine N-acetyltransferase [Kineothrix alysoides]|uniref:Ribosomal-protein-alanine N-acetyltransferase n=1 Tax=Kineothrix alysoides TaxID=1469948 RepID=A0A4R1QWY2_9FIRM|nr:GNAT family protein [Kineothrix alysoides]TCL55020.1 ribosomal-protein-alanine N-acetyltransferase [Kineothrix alysoides]
MEVKLVRWEAEYYGDFFQYSRDKELYDNMSDDFPHTEEECREAVASFAESDDKRACFRAILVDGKVCGCIAAFFESGMYCKNAEIAYWIGKKERGKGIMTKVITDFVNFLFSGFDIGRVYARPFQYNAASCKVLEKTGFEKEGVLRNSVYKNGSIYNAVMYAVIKEAFCNNNE